MGFSIQEILLTDIDVYRRHVLHKSLVGGEVVGCCDDLEEE